MPNIVNKITGWKKIYTIPKWVENDLLKYRILPHSKVYRGKTFLYKIECSDPYENHGHPSKINYHRKLKQSSIR